MSHTQPRLLRCLVAATLAATLAACGDLGGSDEAAAQPPAVSPPPAGNVPPVATFTAADSVVAGEPLPLDARASSDADNDVLTFSWNLGDGQRGGGPRIAAVFATAGSYTVRLTVDDGRGGVHAVDRIVTVTPGAAGLGAVDTDVIVRDTAGALLSGVTVRVNRAGAAQVSTGANGRAAVATERGIPVTLKFSKPGYADQFKTQMLPAGAESGYLPVTMLAREPALTLPSAEAGGELVGKHGVKVVFAPGSLVDGNGAPVSGPVQVAMTPVDVVDNLRAFPGRFAGVRPGGEQGLLLSYGTVEFVLSAAGVPVQLAPGKKATIEIPIYTALKRDGTPIAEGDSFPIWSLNESTGGWTEEGSGIAVAAASPSDLALRAEVTHFSWWNHDDFDSDPGKPKPKCQVDTNLDGVLEDLSGTGYCWHEAVPELSDFAPSNAERAHALASPSRARPLAEPRTRRLPAYAATGTTPAAGGVVLQIPSDMNIVFRAWALNGTLFGSKVVRSAAGVSDEEIIVLEPVAGDAIGLNRIALPYDQRFVMHTRSEIDRFVFTPVAGTTYQVRVSHAGQTVVFGGDVRVTQGSGTLLAEGGFGGSRFERLVEAAGADDITVDVSAGNNAPGVYRIDVVALPSLAACAGAEPLALPMSPRNLVVPANGKLCFTFTLAADEAVTVRADTRGPGNVFTSSLQDAGGATLASKSYTLASGGGGFTMRAAVVQPGTYAVEMVNRGVDREAVVQAFSVARLALDGVLGLPGEATMTRAAGENRSFWYTLRPAQPGDALAVTLDDDTSEHGFRLWPAESSATKTQAGRPVGRVVRTAAALHPLIQVYPTNSTRANTLRLSTRLPLALPSDTTVATTVPAAGTVVVYGFDALLGEALSLDFSSASGTADSPPWLFAPSFGSPITASDSDGGSAFPGIITVGESGSHTLELTSRVGNVGSEYSFRINRLAAPEAITLGTRFERSDVLTLGEIKRYDFAATQGQVIGFGLTSPTALEAALRVPAGIYLRSGFAELSGTVPRAVHTGPRYVQTSGTTTLQVFSQTSGALANRSGAFSLLVQAPTPAPALLGSPISTTLLAEAFAAYRYNIDQPGRHLLCYQHASSVRRGAFERNVETVVWGPSATTANYEGDIVPDGGNGNEFVAALRSGSHTLTLYTRQPAIDVTARLLRLPDSTDIALGAAPATASLAACEQRLHRFVATAGQTYTATVTAGFAGTVRVRKLGADGLPGATVGSSTHSLVAATPRVFSFTIASTASYGSGDYVIEVDATGLAEGSYTVGLASP